MIINNSILTAEISVFGAELISVIKNGREYMWQRDAKYWDRTSPILFPVLGNCPNGMYEIDGVKYKMPLHGFTPESMFELYESTDDLVSFRLCSNTDTYKIYPFEFEFVAKYSLHGSVLTVTNIITNKDSKDMPFMVGAHPGFAFKDGMNYFIVYSDREVPYKTLFSPVEGDADKIKYLSPNICHPIDSEAFRYSSYTIENSGCHKVSLCGEDKIPYVTVSFDADGFLLWRLRGGEAPFLCIEPKNGKGFPADGTDKISELDGINILHPEESHIFTYDVEFI